MSEMIFQQDGTQPNTAMRTQRLLKEKITNFLDKDSWPKNSPDLSPIKNLWSIFQDKLQEVRPAPQNIQSLERALIKAWKMIPRETLENLIHSMPRRIQAVIEAKEEYPIL